MWYIDVEYLGKVCREHGPFDGEECSFCKEDKEYNEKYKKDWPNYCTKCEGWGGSIFYENHGDKHGMSEPLFEPCENNLKGFCCRCGAVDMFTEENNWEGPCITCGWDYQKDEGLRKN